MYFDAFEPEDNSIESWAERDDPIPDEWISELFDDAYDTTQSHLEMEERETNWETAVSPEFKAEMAAFAEKINYDTAGMHPEDAEEYMEFAWGALIGPLVSALAPVAMKAVGGLLNRRRSSSRRPPSRTRQPQTPVRSQPAPRQNQSGSTRPAPPTRRGSNAGVSTSRRTVGRQIGQAGQTALQVLSSILQDPNIINMITNLASTGISVATRIGENDIMVREGAILNAIAEYAKMAKMEFIRDHHEEDFDYLMDDSGEYLTDPSSPASRARQFADVFLEN